MNYVLNHHLTFIRIDILLVAFVLFPFNVFSQISKEDSLTGLLQNAGDKQKMEVLSELIKLSSRKTPEKSIGYGEQFQSLLKDYKDDGLKSEAWFNLAVANIYLRNFDIAVELLKEDIELYRQLDLENNVAKAISQLAYVYYRKGDFNSAYKYIVEAQPMSENLEDENQKAVDMFRRGVFAKGMGKYEEAIVYYNKAIEVYQKMENEKMVANLLGNIGNVLFELNHKEKALSYHEKALIVYEKIGDSMHIAGSLNDIGNAYSRLGNNQLALDYYFRAYEINKKINNDNWLAYNLANIGTIYSDFGDYEKAIDFLQRSVLLKEKNKDTKSLVVSYASLGSTFLKQKKYRKALTYLHKASDLAESLGIQLSVPVVYKEMALTYSFLGDNKKAYHYQSVYSVQKDSIFNKEKIEAINDIQEKYESVEREKEIQQLKFDKEMQGKKQVMLVILILSIVVFSALIALNFMIKRRKDKQILVQKDILHKKEQDLAKLELEQTKLKKIELQNESDFKSRQLTTHALNMMQKSKLLQELQADINELGKKSPSELNPEFRRVNQLINRNLKSDNEWDVFKMYFEQVNKNFYSSLMVLSPELTNYDLRLCALIKLNLNIKETASVLNVAPNSIKSARYRLRKKLNMEQEDDLYEFVRDIG